MKAQHIRPRVQNGPITRRRSASDQSLPKTSTRAARSSHGRKSKAEPRQSRETRENGSRVFWLMVLAGGLLTGGFLLGLRSQIAAHQLNQAEERLKNEFDRYASQQKFLSLEQQRALSPRESERAVKEAGLVQLKFDRQSAVSAIPARFDAAANSMAGKSATGPASGKSVALVASKKPSGKNAKEANAAIKQMAGKQAISKQNAVKAPLNKTPVGKTPAGKAATGKALSKPAKAEAEKPRKTKKESSAPRQIAKAASRR